MLAYPLFNLFLFLFHDYPLMLMKTAEDIGEKYIIEKTAVAIIKVNNLFAAKLIIVSPLQADLLPVVYDSTQVCPGPRV